MMNRNLALIIKSACAEMINEPGVTRIECEYNGVVTIDLTESAFADFVEDFDLEETKTKPDKGGFFFHKAYMDGVVFTALGREARQ